MNALWNANIDDIIEAMELAQSRGKKPGDSFESEFLEIMEKKGKKPFSHTEFTREELIADLTQKSYKIFDIQTDPQGQPTYRVIKSKNEEKK